MVQPRSCCSSIAAFHVDPNRSQSLEACCCVEAVERDYSYGLGAEGTRSTHFSDGKLRCGGNAANLGAAGSN